MPKETTAIVEEGIKTGKTLVQLQQQKVSSKYDQWEPVMPRRQASTWSRCLNYYC
jgi:hypothetical protein